MTDFQKKLSDLVRDAGQDLINNADEYVSSVEFLRYMTITIRFDSSFSTLQPTIEVDKEYVCKTAHDRYTKGEKNDD